MTSQPSLHARDGEILPPDWAELSPLLDVVLDAAPNERGRALDAVSAGDAVRRGRLVALLRETEQPVPLLDAPAAAQFPLLSASDALRLPDLLGERYRTDREIGEGGMAHVYLAHDIKHGRDVAVKVIKPDVAASLGRERFLREIAIAARLRHPNIVPLYDSGDANGLLYFVMPYEDGPSLRTRLARDGALPIAEAVSALRDVARALKYAHAHGVVHRDIKPDNVMLSGGAAVVADFGIAKAVSVAQTAAGQSAITQTGAGIGTPAYMSPEQAVGDPSADHRGDIYSFGCLAYELLTGKPPFHGMTTREVIVAHLSTAPVPVTATRVDAPPAIATLIGQCLEKEPSARPQDASALLDVLDNSTASYLAAGALSTTLSRRTRLAGALMVVLAGSAAVWASRTRAVEPGALSVSVLPIGNIGSDSALAPFALSLGDEIFSALSKVPGVVARSRSGAKAFNNGSDVSEVGRKLGVDYLITGDMREERGRWIVTANLTRTADASEVWNERFDVDPTQQLNIAERIATGAANALRQRFPGALGVASAQRQTASPGAYRNYMLGQELLSRRGLSVRESAAAFRRAIAIDSSYAGAYAGLSMALALYPHFQRTRPAEVYHELTTAAQRALAIDSTVAQAHVALGLAYQHLNDWSMAGKEFRAALRLTPGDVEAHVQMGRHLLFLGKLQEGLQQFQDAREADPASPLVLSWVSYSYFLLGQRDSALAISHQAQEGQYPNFTAIVLGALVHVHSGERDSAAAYLRRMSEGISTVHAYVRSVLGDHSAVIREVSERNRTDPNRATAHTTEAFAYLGVADSARALAALERATDAQEIWPEFQPVSDPQFNSVRESPRFRALMRRVGLPEQAALVPPARRVSGTRP